MRSNTDDKVKRFKDQIIANATENSINYQILCDNLVAIEQLPSMQEALSLIYPENIVDANNISGIDVRATLNSTDMSNLNTTNFTITPAIDFLDAAAFKYVSDAGSPSAKPYYSRWKDTAYVDAFKVQQYRIRWTKSEFSEVDRANEKYFNVPNDQLREYPGFVYHCHILRHEDNEMMRPIMLQLPTNAHLNLTTPCNQNTHGGPMLNWSDKYECINNRCL